jgi:hypothetical protein
MQSESYSIAELEAFAARYYQGRALLMTPYGYNVSFSSIAPGATVSQVVSISANADFIITGFHHRASVAAAGQTVSNKTAPLVRVLITDSGSNEQFTNSAVDLENYSTNGNIINKLDYPRIISGRSTLTVQMTSYEASATIAPLDFFMEGVLVRAYAS